MLPLSSPGKYQRLRFLHQKKRLCMMPDDFFDCIPGDAAAAMVQPWKTAQKAGELCRNPTSVPALLSHSHLCPAL